MPRKHLVDKKRAKYIVILASAILALALLFMWARPYLSIFADRDQAQVFVESLGVFGPIVFILMQVAQIIVAPIPGQITGLLGGYVFGAFWGFVLAMIGAAIGFGIVFIVARRYGRPLLEKFFDKKKIDKYDGMIQSRGPATLFLIFLLPGFPDDLICFLAGLTKIPIRTLLIISLLGRAPGFLALSLTGAGLSLETLNIFIAVGVGVVIAGLIAYWQRQWLQGLVQAEHKIAYVQRNWKLSGWMTLSWCLGLLTVIVLLTLFATLDGLQIYGDH